MAKKRKAATAVADAVKGGGIKDFLKSGKAKGGLASIAAWMALDGLMNAGNQAADKKVQRQGMQDQAELATPDNLYYQAALPGAKAEEEQARNALMTHMSGGVLGPQVGRGERLIGRR